MGFLSPWLLLLGVAAIVPVLLHLMHRRPGPRLDFPALRYLRRAQKESGRRVRLRQLLLLALRVAAVALLAFAAARPFLRAGTTGHAPTDVAIVLDNSMSTGVVGADGRVFDALRGAAGAALQAAGPDDRFWLIRAAEPDRPALFGDRARIATALTDVEPVDARADVRAAVRRARALLAAAATDRPAEIHVLTDLQATAFDAASAATQTRTRDPATQTRTPDAGTQTRTPDAGSRAPVATRRTPAIVVFGPTAEAPANTGVGAIGIAGGLAPRAGVAATASAEVVGGRTEVVGGRTGVRAGPDSATLRLFLDGRPVAAALAAPGAAAVFTLPARPPGVVVGHVEGESDALRADDRRWFAYSVVPPIPVAAPPGAPFVREALAALAAANRIALVPSTRADVVVDEAAAMAVLPGDAAALVLMPPDSAQYLPAANEVLARLGTGLRLAPDARSGTSAIDARATAPELRDARVARAYQVVVADDARADTLLRLADGRPWLVRARASSGARVLLLASPLVPDASTVPASAAMIPLLDRLIGQWTGAAQGGDAALEPGMTVQLPARTAALLDPADSLLTVEGGAPFLLPPRSGVYRALASAHPGAEVLAAWAVGPAPSESRLDRIDGDAAADALRDDGGEDVDVEFATDADDWRNAIFVDRTGGQWWRALLLAAIVALLAESFIAARKPASSSEPSASS